MKMDDEEETKPTDRKCIVDKMIDTNEEEPTMPQSYTKVKSRFQWCEHDTSR